MDDVIILTSKNYTHYSRGSHLNKVVADDLYNKSFFCRYIRHIPVLSYCSLAAWKLQLDRYGTVIVFDSLLTKQALYSLVSLCKNLRLILFFRNKVTKRTKAWNFDKLIGLGVEIWSYNLSDCREYGFEYHPDPPDDQLLENCKPSGSLEYDMVFLGDNKGREKELLDIISICNEYGLAPYLYVIHGESIPGNKCVANQYMNYTNYLALLCKSKAVLDVVNERNWGLTYRPFEALFLRKKLVTNYKEIEEYDFYDSENIFILGKDNPARISEFLNSPYKNVDKAILDIYRTKNWLKGFRI